MKIGSSPTMALSQAERDFQFSPSLSAKDAAGALAKMVTQTTEAREDPNLLVQKNIPYGPKPRQLLDHFCPVVRPSPKMPCLAFIHGGFWQEGDKDVAGFAARAFADLGWSYVSIGYSLTPEVSLTEIVEEISSAVNFLAENAADLGFDKDRMILAGHSAGGHLSACVAADVLGLDITNKIAGAVLISGVFDLEPVALSYVNDLAKITKAEINTLSPTRFEPARKIPVLCVIGEDETDAFHHQTQDLMNAWGDALDQISLETVAGRDHFDILQELNEPVSATVKAILKLIPV